MNRWWCGYLPALGWVALGAAVAVGGHVWYMAKTYDPPQIGLPWLSAFKVRFADGYAMSGPMRLQDYFVVDRYRHAPLAFLKREYAMLTVEVNARHDPYAMRLAMNDEAPGNTPARLEWARKMAKVDDVSGYIPLLGQLEIGPNGAVDLVAPPSRAAITAQDVDLIKASSNRLMKSYVLMRYYATADPAQPAQMEEWKGKLEQAVEQARVSAIGARMTKIYEDIPVENF